MKEIKVYGYKNSIHGRKPRRPLVHIMGFDSPGEELSSLTFKPEHAEQLCVTIRRAARAAKQGRGFARIVKVAGYEEEFDDFE